jgi:hypothetical protein
MSYTDQERALALDAELSDAAESVDATEGRIHRLLPATYILTAIIVMAGWLYMLASFLIWLLSKFATWLIS